MMAKGQWKRDNSKSGNATVKLTGIVQGSRITTGKRYNDNPKNNLMYWFKISLDKENKKKLSNAIKSASENAGVSKNWLKTKRLKMYKESEEEDCVDINFNSNGEDKKPGVAIGKVAQKENEKEVVKGSRVTVVCRAEAYDTNYPGAIESTTLKLILLGVVVKTKNSLIVPNTGLSEGSFDSWFKNEIEEGDDGDDDDEDGDDEDEDEEDDEEDNDGYYNEYEDDEDDDDDEEEEAPKPKPKPKKKSKKKKAVKKKAAKKKTPESVEDDDDLADNLLSELGV